jgi:hypothetical protein
VNGSASLMARDYLTIYEVLFFGEMKMTRRN